MTFEWTQKPVLQLTASESALSVKTTTGGAGVLKTDDGEPIVEVSALKLIGTGQVTVEAHMVVPPRSVDLGSPPSFTAGPLHVQPGPVMLKVEQIKLEPNEPLCIPMTVTLRELVVSSVNNPTLTLPLAVEFKVTVQGGRLQTTLHHLEVREPYPLNLLTKAVEFAGEMIRLVGAIEVPAVGLPPPNLTALLERIGAMLAAALRWLAEQAASAGQLLASVGDTLVDALNELLRRLRGLLPDAKAPPLYKYLAFEIRLDPRNWSLRQVVLMPAGDEATLKKKHVVSTPGVDIGFNLQARPALVIDFRHEWFGLVLQGIAEQQVAMLGTDLWLAKSSGPAEPMGLIDAKSGHRPDSSPKALDNGSFGKPARLVGVTVTTKHEELVLFAVQRGTIRFFQVFDVPSPASPVTGAVADAAGNTGAAASHRPDTIKLANGVTATAITECSDLRDADWDELLHVDPYVDTVGLKDRLLNLLPKPAPDRKADNGFLAKLSQYVKVREAPQPSIKKGQLTLDLPISIVIAGESIDTALHANVDLRDFSATLTGADVIDVRHKGYKKFPLLGFDVTVAPKVAPNSGAKEEEVEYTALRLDLRAGRQSFGLYEKEAKADLEYRAASSSGRGMVFDVSRFEVSSGGLDLAAAIRPDPVVLGGVDMPFRFTSGGIDIRRSRFLGGSLAGSGQLPRALIGEANANIAIALTRATDDDVIIESAEARLDKTGDPIVCDATRFKLMITELGLGFVRENGYHFYFQLTGSARFAPNPGEAAEGLLKHLGALEIQLNKTPLTSDPRVLMRFISFQVKCEPLKTGSLFEIFSFELRGFGFHPSVQAFGGDPAISVSGQVKFAFGDKVSTRIDCHQLYIAAPRPPSSFPRVRFDGLMVGLQLAGMASVEGTAIAVDEKLPELFKPTMLPADVTANGFLAAGRIDIAGWASMSANMGFLELRKEGAAPRHAFYFYGQRNKLAEKIPTPVGNIFLREVGYGFGYRYTLAGIAEAERAQSPRELIRILDEVSKYQGSLDQIRSWNPTYDNAGLTLAMRALFTVAAASTSESYQEDAEKELPNPLLFDVVAAIRSDLTLLMNVRSWLSVNYADWCAAGEAAGLKSNPTQRGYLYLSAPRQEFLGRFISDGKGYVGKHPKLPEALEKAIAGSIFTATLYIRPGLFHFELGWPFELQMQYGDPKGAFFLQCNGGLIHRIEDGAMLMGIAFRGVGHARFEGRVGSDSLGASASAFAQFALEAKAISYLSLRSPGETMLYASFQLNVTVGVSVQVWLRFKIWRHTVSLRAGFRLSLTLSVGVELVLLADKGIGGRAHVAIGVQAFGRSLSLGIGFAFGSGNLALARARVARFMELGLGVETPAPDALAAPRAQRHPSLEASRGDRAAVADRRTDEDAERPAEAPQPPKTEEEERSEPRAEGRVIQRSHFWAIVFPTVDRSRPAEKLYVLQWVPRDHTPVDGIDEDTEASTFYASPAVERHGAQAVKCLDNPGSNVGHTLRLDDQESLERLRGIRDEHGIGFAQLTDQGEAKEVDQAAWQTELLLACTVIPKQGDQGERITFGDLLTELFLHVPENKNDMTEPASVTVQAERSTLGPDAQANADRLARAGRERRRLQGVNRQAAEVMERRSAMLGAVIETAADLAAHGADANGLWPRMPDEQLDCRHFGLTFVVHREALDVLFKTEAEAPLPETGIDAPAPETRADAPPAGRSLSIEKRDAVNDPGSVHLFNPPSRHFVQSAPRLAGLTSRSTASGIELDWDLEPAWGHSGGAYADPEFHLSHYVIVRRIVRLKGGQWTTSFRVKGAAPIETVEGGQRFIRPAMQFVDDFSQPEGMPQELRDVLLGRPVEDAARVWAHYSDEPAITVEYDITPVDVAGTSDAATPFEHLIRKPVSHLVTPVEVRLQVVHAAMPVLGWTPTDSDERVVGDRETVLRFAIALRKEPEDGDDVPAAPATGSQHRRRGCSADEAIAALRRRPDEAEMSAPREGDVDFKLTAGRSAAGHDDVAARPRRPAGPAKREAVVSSRSRR
ncbi:MAG: hypothetical protein QM742_07670 [Aquabacterium sp.]